VLGSCDACGKLLSEKGVVRAQNKQFHPEVGFVCFPCMVLRETNSLMGWHVLQRFVTSCYCSVSYAKDVKLFWMAGTMNETVISGAR
jgi:hypothetical protein